MIVLGTAKKIIDNLWNSFTFRRRKCVCELKPSIAGKIFIHGKKGRVSFGINCRIISSVLTNPTSGFDHTHITVSDTGKITIGNNVGISNSCISSASHVSIEDNVIIGSGCMISDSDHHSIVYEYRMGISDTHISTKPISIKEGAFIGARSIILKGVTIGKHSVIGAGSVVTKNVPDSEIWAGNPARFIKIIE